MGALEEDVEREGAETKRVQRSPRGSGKWEEPMGNPELEESDVGPEISQDEAPGRSRGSEEPWWRRPRPGVSNSIPGGPQRCRV